MNLAEPGKKREEGDPNANIEDAEKDKDLPVLEIDSLWREGSVLSVRLGEKSKKTTNELDTPRSIRNPRLRLVVVLCVQVRLARVFSNGSMNHQPTRKPEQRREHEQEAQSRRRPNRENDLPRSERSRGNIIEPITPKPQRGNSDFLQSLNDASTRESMSVAAPASSPK